MQVRDASEHNEIKLSPIELKIQRQLQKLTKGRSEFLIDAIYFCLKELRSCLFAGLFFLAVFCLPRHPIFGVPRYDLLLIVAISIQAWMVWRKLESLDELKAISLFHVLGFGLEVFKTSSGIRSWSYPDFAYAKILGVPLFAGFMYAAVGSYIIQAWRFFEIRILRHPSNWMAALLSIAIYANFFTHHYIPDFRWHLGACALGLYSRSVVIFRPHDRERKMPLLVAFILIGFFIWIAENMSTFLGVWRCPNQLGAWSIVHIGKWSSWSLLVIMTFTIVANLKRFKESIEV